MSTMVQSYAIPSKCATKALNMKTSATGARKIVISTNWLVLFGFEAGTKVVERSLGASKGIVVQKASDVDNPPARPKKVYKRTYKSRRNNPLEILMELSNQSLINESFDTGCSRVHVCFENGRITIKPLVSHKEQAIKNLTRESSNQVFAVCSSGVDMSMMEEHGFTANSLLDFRPVERRDYKRKSDLTETGCLTALRNSKGIKNLFNEDINTISTEMLKKACADDMFAVLQASPQCSEFTTVKSKSFKESANNDLSSTLDMTYDMMRIIEALAPPVVAFEQVKGWFKSQIFELLDLRMRRWGYQSNVILANATDFGGHTLRPRGYAVYSCLPCEFSFEEPVGQSVNVWELVKPLLHECRDISNNKSIQDGEKVGRLRVLHKDSNYCPTFLRSQAKLCKDTCVLMDGAGRYLMPTEKIMKLLMGISESFSLDCVSQDVGSEIIGQSVDGQFHSMVARSIKRHIEQYVQMFLGGGKSENVTGGALPMQLSIF